MLIDNLQQHYYFITFLKQYSKELIKDIEDSISKVNHENKFDRSTQQYKDHIDANKLPDRGMIK